MRFVWISLFLCTSFSWCQISNEADARRVGRELLARFEAAEKTVLPPGDAAKMPHRKALARAMVDAQWNVVRQEANWLVDHGDRYRTVIATLQMLGLGTSKDPEGARETLRAGAEDGEIDAMRFLAILYEQGKDTAQDLEQAFHWYRMAADRGDLSGRRYLARAYENGLGVRPDPEKANFYRELTSGKKQEDDPDQKRIEATFMTPGLEQAYKESKSNSPQSAARVIKTLTGNKDPAAQAWLAFLVKQTVPGEAGKTRYRELLTSAADAGNSFAQSLLGACYMIGAECPKDFTLAQKYLEPAATAGWRMAQLSLAFILKTQKGAIEDRKKWLRSAAEQGSHQAQFELAGILFFERSTTAKSEALQWFIKAAQDCEYGAAAVEASAAYERGSGTPIDLAEAFRWAERASLCGIPRGWTRLGYEYANGHGVEKNPTEAVRCYRVGADLGDPLSQFNLAEHYRAGLGVERNYAAAARWYLRVARQREEREQASKACSRIAHLYEQGSLPSTDAGVESPQIAAYVFYELADRGGFHNDRAKHDRLYAAMTLEDREAAAKALEPWAKLYPPAQGVTTSQSTQTIQTAEAVQSAKLLRRVSPDEPPGASGEVVLKALIAIDGTIESLEVRSGDPVLAANAMAAVRRWIYKPTFLRGVRVKVLTTITIVFPSGTAAKQ